MNGRRPPRGMAIVLLVPLAAVVANTIATGGIRLGTGAQAHHNFTGKDPGFVDARRGDFRLAAGSACVDAGAAVEGYTEDFKGRAPDIGARERGAAAWRAGHDWGEPPPVWMPPGGERR